MAMRYMTTTVLLMAGCAALAADDYREVRELRVGADGLETMVINVGEGGLDVRGVPDQDQVEVRATIIVTDADDEEGQEFIARRVQLSLDRDDNSARLVSRVDQKMFAWGSGGRVDLELTVPSSVALRIEDGAGSMNIADMVADVAIQDGSGSIDVSSVGNLEIDDGSGSIEVSEVAGDVYVTDGSGSLTIEGVDGSVTITDGSGSILVDGVGKDLVIIESGSGSVRFSGIAGSVEQDD
jgi:hypothetical protein